MRSGVTTRADHSLHVSQTSELLTPILWRIPLQPLTYHAVDRDCDVDQPRKLAKSVTVE